MLFVSAGGAPLLGVFVYVCAFRDLHFLVVSADPLVTASYVTGEVTVAEVISLYGVLLHCAGTAQFVGWGRVEHGPNDRR